VRVAVRGEGIEHSRQKLAPSPSGRVGLKEAVPAAAWSVELLPSPATRERRESDASD
jgi:hypothetical protein